MHASTWNLVLDQIGLFLAISVFLFFWIYSDLSGLCFPFPFPDCTLCCIWTFEDVRIDGRIVSLFMMITRATIFFAFLLRFLLQWLLNHIPLLHFSLVLLFPSFSLSLCVSDCFFLLFSAVFNFIFKPKKKEKKIYVHYIYVELLLLRLDSPISHLPYLRIRFRMSDKNFIFSCHKSEQQSIRWC